MEGACVGTCTYLQTRVMCGPRLILHCCSNAMAKKRSHEEAFGDLSSVRCSPNAKLRGVLHGVSPEMKKSGTCCFWDGELCDEQVTLRVYGYDPAVRRKLFDYQERGCTINLSKCAVKEGRSGNGMEIFAGSVVGVEESGTDVDVEKVRLQRCVKVGSLGDLTLFKSYNIRVKVVSAAEALRSRTLL